MRFTYLFLLFCLLNIHSTSAMMVISPDAVIVVNIDKKLYKIKWSEQKNIDKIENLDSRLIQQNDWKTIIQSSEPEYATALLKTLNSYLSKDELWPYVHVGLLRHENRLNYNYNVADMAYYYWSNQTKDSEIWKIRTHYQYRKNLTVISNWHSMFAQRPNKDMNLDEAVSQLRLTETLPEIHNRYESHKLMSTIALSTDTDGLMELIHDENFDIALASWYGLSRAQPTKVAYDILSQAIWRTEKTDYSFGSGCTRFSDALSPGMAAYDLFSDYLTSNQLAKILQDDPIINGSNQTKDYRYMSLKSPNLVKALLKSNVNDEMILGLRSKKLTQKMALANVSELIELLSSDDNVYNIRKLDFNYKLLTAIKEISKNYTNAEKNIFVQYAFKSKNAYARKFIEFLISNEFPANQFEENIDLLKYQTWPKNWHDLKLRTDELFIKLGLDQNK